MKGVTVERTWTYTLIAILCILSYLTAEIIVSYYIYITLEPVAVTIALFMLLRLMTIIITQLFFKKMKSGCCYYFGFFLFIVMAIQGLFSILILLFKVFDGFGITILALPILLDFAVCSYLIVIPLDWFAKNRKNERFQYVVIPLKHIEYYPNY